MNHATDIPAIVLLSGGLESTLLAKTLLLSGTTVSPIHVRCGFIWEECESLYLQRFCRANACEGLLPLLEISYPHQDALKDHWAICGVNIPQRGDTAKALEIPRRNLTLLTVAGAHHPQLPELHLVIGTTADNSYSDGTRAFFDECEQHLSRDFQRPVKISTPLLGLDKSRVIRQAERETLALSFSCIAPQQELHCGACYKCDRRQAAFRKAGVEDPTVYASRLV